MRRLLSLSLVLCAWGLWLTGCSETQDPPAPPDPDKARECVEGGGTPTADASLPDGGMAADAGAPAGGCRSTELCIEGRCYERCTSDAQCGPREQCGSGGACERRAGPEPDSGPIEEDAGPGDPCDSVMCMDPEVCHPISTECTRCNEEGVSLPRGSPGNCDGLLGICDIANGACVAATPAQCAPCNLNLDCEGDMTFVGTCAVRDVMDWREQVCLRSCDAMTPCPDGSVCNSDSFCEPPAGITCTTWLAATTRRACLGDDDCNIAGSSGSSSFFTETCEGESFPPPLDGGAVDGGPPDAGPPTPGVCVQPCADTTDCFNAAGGQMCTDTGTGLTFCIP